MFWQGLIFWYDNYGLWPWQAKPRPKKEEASWKIRKKSRYYGMACILLDLIMLTLNRSPVAQWAKRWPTDLAIPSSMPARVEIFSVVNGIPLHMVFRYQ